MPTAAERSQLEAEFARELRHAIRSKGPQSDYAKAISIQFCRLLGIDPFFRYSIQQETEFVTDRGAPVLMPTPYCEEWQKLIARAQEA